MIFTYELYCYIYNYRNVLEELINDPKNYERYREYATHTLNNLSVKEFMSLKMEIKRVDEWLLKAEDKLLFPENDITIEDLVI